jgi:hypothetical protein
MGGVCGGLSASLSAAGLWWSRPGPLLVLFGAACWTDRAGPSERAAQRGGAACCRRGVLPAPRLPPRHAQWEGGATLSRAPPARSSGGARAKAPPAAAHGRVLRGERLGAAEGAECHPLGAWWWWGGVMRNDLTSDCSDVPPAGWSGNRILTAQRRIPWLQCSSRWDRSIAATCEQDTVLGPTLPGFRVEDSKACQDDAGDFGRSDRRGASAVTAGHWPR